MFSPRNTTRDLYVELSEEAVDELGRVAADKEGEWLRAKAAQKETTAKMKAATDALEYEVHTLCEEIRNKKGVRQVRCLTTADTHNEVWRTVREDNGEHLSETMFSTEEREANLQQPLPGMH